MPVVYRYISYRLFNDIGIILTEDIPGTGTGRPLKASSELFNLFD
jgi:hypothetical protein